MAVNRKLTKTRKLNKGKKSRKSRKVKQSNRNKKSNKTRKTKGGTHQTVNESLLSKKIPQAVIDFDINKYLGDIDQHTLYDTEIIDFIPKIDYEFVYDGLSHEDYPGPYSDARKYELDKTRFDDATKEKIDECIRLYAFQDEMNRNDGRLINKTPRIVVNVELSMGELDTRGRPPDEDDELVINTQEEGHQHEVNVVFTFNDETIDFEDLTCGMKLFAVDPAWYKMYKKSQM